MLYQMGEVVQIGVSIEKTLAKWVLDTYLELGVPKDERKSYLSFEAQINLARRLTSRLAHHTDQEKQWIRDAFADTLAAMQIRNRVVHDQWVSFDDGYLTRFGHFAARDGLEATEIEPGDGPGQYTHDEWEQLRTRLWHCWFRLSSLNWVRRYPPDYGYFFSRVDEHYAMVRGEFYLGRDFLVPFAMSKLTQAEVDQWSIDSEPSG